jgi:hypothetical protein
MTLHRRGFLTGLGALIAAPAIVSVSNIMPVKSMPIELEQFDAVYLRAEWPTISEIVATALKNNSMHLSENLMRNNALLQRLMTNGALG